MLLFSFCGRVGVGGGGGGVEKLRLKLTLAKVEVEVEAQHGNIQTANVHLKHCESLKSVNHPPPPVPQTAKSN